MTDINRESARFRRDKAPILRRYIDDHDKLFSVVAGRGFYTLPGFAYHGILRLEIMTKEALSELNYKILSDTIERELKQTGIDYDQAYKNALMAWELSKQTLLSAWEQEYADIKLGRALTEEALDQLQIVVSARGTYLLERKTEIELEAEGYKQQLADLDADTAPYELTLANAKLATATKRLNLIPILQSLISAEEALIVAETASVSGVTDLMTAETAVMNKKQARLLPTLGDLVAISELYTAEIPKQIELDLGMANERLTQIGVQAEMATEKYDQVVKDVSIAANNSTLHGLKTELTEQQKNLELVRLRKELSNTQLTTSSEGDMHRYILDQETGSKAYALDSHLSQTELDLDTKEAAASDKKIATVEKNTEATANDVATSSEVTGIQATTSIVNATLQHVLG